MTDDIRDKMKDLPDLPGLEAAEQKGNSLLPILLYLGLMIAMIGPIAVMTIRYYGNYIDQRGKVCIVLCVALLTWVILRILSGYYRFKTDANGFTMIGVLRRRFIPWIDVEDASMRETRIGAPVITLKTKRGKVKFVPSNWALLASTWQHLRRLGRAENIVLPPGSLAFWEPVPDDVPHEVDWSKKSAIPGKIGAFAAVIILGGISIAAWFEFSLRSLAIVMPISTTIILLSMLKWAVLPDILHAPWRIRLREDYIEAHLPFAKAYIPWSEVTSARLFNKNYLIINYGSRNSEIRILYMQGKKELEDLILAIIRRIRTSSKVALPMPEIHSRNREALYKPAYSSQESQRTAQAFLNTLEPPVRKKISNLYYTQFASFLFGMAGFFIIMCTSLLERFNRILHSTPNMQSFFTGPDFWLCLPAVVVVVGVATIICNRIVSKLPGNYREAWIKLNKVTMRRADAVVFRVALALAAVSLLSCIPYIDSYTRVTDKGITTNGFWSLGKEDFYSWSQVEHVFIHESYGVNHGQTCKSVSYEVIFADGKRWKTDQGNLGLLCSKNLDSAIEYIAEKSGRKLEYAEPAK